MDEGYGEMFLEEGGCRYAVRGGKAIIVGFAGDMSDLASVPAELGGYPVAELKFEALGLPEFSPPVYPDGEGECIGADLVVFDRNITEIKYVPDGLTELVIPASVRRFKDNVFPRPLDLGAVSVEKGNRSFGSFDGMLFSADMSELLMIPPMKEGVCSIPAGVKRLEDAVNCCCPLLRAFEVESGNKAYRSLEGVLYTCDMLSLVACPNGWSGYLRIPDGVVRADLDVMNDLSELDGIWFPASMTAIAGKWRLSGCDRLVALDVAEGNAVYRSLDGVLFNKDMTRLIRFPPGKTGRYEVPTEVRFLEEFAFYWCRRLERITFPATAICEGPAVFLGCEGRVFRDRVGELTEGVFRYVAGESGALLTEVTGLGSKTVTVPATLGGLPVTEVAERAFEKCSGVRSILIPKTVIRFESGAFSGCGHLTEIRVEEGNPKYKSVNGMLFEKDGKTLVWSPAGKEGVAWVPASATHSVRDNLASCSDLMAFEVDPDNPEFCSREGVLYSKDMRWLIACAGGWAGELRIPEGVLSVSDGALTFCPKVTKIFFPASLFEFGGHVYCEKLAAFEVDEGNAFYQSSGGVLYNKGMHRLIACPPAFAGTLRIPDGVEEIGGAAFWFCDQLTEIFLPASLRCIRGIQRTTGLNELAAINVDEDNPIYKSVKGVLYSMDMRELVRFPEGKSGWFTVPPQVEGIASMAFSNCKKVERIDVPPTVIRIGEKAFEGCEDRVDVDRRVRLDIW